MCLSFILCCGFYYTHMYLLFCSCYFLCHVLCPHHLVCLHMYICLISLCLKVSFVCLTCTLCLCVCPSDVLVLPSVAFYTCPHKLYEIVSGNGVCMCAGRAVCYTIMIIAF